MNGYRVSRTRDTDPSRLSRVPKDRVCTLLCPATPVAGYGSPHGTTGVGQTDHPLGFAEPEEV
jgi:hypothetical protein